MKGTKNQDINEALSIIQDITEMESWVNEMLNRLEKEVLPKIGDEADKKDKEDFLKYLYWNVPRLNTKTIAVGLGYRNSNSILKKVGKHDTQIECDKCNEFIYVANRTELASIHNNAASIVMYWDGEIRIWSPWKTVCQKCLKVIYEERANWGKTEEQKQMIQSQIDYERRIEEEEIRKFRMLKTMPYREYLQTSYWQSRRLRHLQSAGYRCQVCNEGDDILDVHHRTYERRGAELFSDLLVLCRGCHDLFHKERKLK